MLAPTVAKATEDEDIVRAGGNTRNNMNKAWVAEAVHGSPPFYFFKRGCKIVYSLTR